MKKDRIRFGPQVGPGSYAALRRDPDGSENGVVVRQGGDGAPLLPGTEIASISSADDEGWHDVETLYRSGPAQVATPQYREGYDRIFGKAKVGLA